MEATQLTSDAVAILYAECVHRQGEAVDESVSVQTVRGVEEFHRGRVYQAREQIVRLLSQLADAFRSPEGERSSRACFTAHGRQWTQLEQMVSHLFAMGVAVGVVEILGETSNWPQNHTDPHVRILD